MLINGAVKVYSIDVGYGQLAWKLRSDSRVVNMERTNIRYVTKEDIGTELDFASIDVSFISLTKVLGPIHAYLKEEGEIVALIKPQFEAGREKVGKNGVVRETSTHIEVVEMIYNFVLESVKASIEKNKPIDGVLMNCHGAMVAEGHDDGEGDLFEFIRKLVGDEIPLISTLGTSLTSIKAFANKL